MNRSFKLIAFLACGLLLLSFLTLVVNQTAQVVELADRLNPTLGWIVLIGLIGLYATLAGVPLLLLARLPRSLDPPASPDDPRLPAHLAELQRRLASNPNIAPKLDVEPTVESIQAALEPLHAQADRLVRDTAQLIFLSTAVSQFGKLDALIVLVLQSRMVWRLAHLYHQRPTPREIARLYANVLGTAFAAGALDEADLNEVVQPVLSSSLGSLVGVIPGLQAAATIVVNSVMTGTANAYLTLRVGLIARDYCGAVILRPAPELRRGASIEAARLLGEIVARGSAQVVSAVKGRLGGAIKTGFQQTVGTVVDRGRGAVASATGYASDARGFVFSFLSPAKTGPGSTP